MKVIWCSRSCANVWFSNNNNISYSTGFPGLNCTFYCDKGVLAKFYELHERLNLSHCDCYKSHFDHTETLSSEQWLLWTDWLISCDLHTD